ncbi:MAG: hypothetical protein GPJ07_06700 [Microcystis aeruginosa G13-07]|uniref:Uncharacterized protein n=1 Tax=Microcystis aeruginosa G11-04 TaxID=2685956 RepID=A0A966FXV8_MICAE|nr:hypothetical protein [Microcystis aeruginosa WS75]NCR11988.1 hypothetical protein [Microcystis aeruginosa SX13-11]NCS01780.1 hypothetical protein [Microcystis aeruginosa G13-11]NCS06307.1 hypothetical protein [Microcystis aeruginosa G13-07]NCS10909.1 hypothetical protein [Microcystis aeruginosa G13-09]NCS39121.1 hypothetical protein [Microcystis aeruginosa BS13-10]NCS56404.1 hypothetical protein [Microcystis aeruginosa G11-04]NCT45049.1 hypothetical protein [Microcystis aeruginosa G11-09]
MGISFENAIQQTQDLLSQIEFLDAKTITQKFTELVSTENGARGFFVTYLTSDLSHTEYPSLEVITALKTSPIFVNELLVKNLAMSTAMVIYHRSQGDKENAQGSEKVQEKTGQLIKQLLSPALGEKLQQLATSLNTGQGEYQAFLELWGYDNCQRQAIAEIIQPFLQ